MYADLSGFTAMSDKLSVLGRLGSEELASVMNGIFDPLLDIIFSHGGDVIKFGGDSVLVLFRGREHTKKAVVCGLALLSNIGSSYQVKTSAGDFPMRIHIGISRGQALSVITGKKGSRYDHLFCGPDVSRAVAATDSAGSGRLFVTDSCVDYLPKGIGLKKGKYYKITGSLNRGPRSKVDTKDSLSPRFASLGQFILREFRERFSSGQSGIDGEHRPLTTIFIGIDGWHKNLAAAGRGDRSIYRKINDHIVTLFQITEKYGGNIVRLDISETGEKALILFGAPVLRENAPSDALRAALEMVEVTKNYSKSLPAPLKIKIGVNSGSCYVGDVGGSFRREYTAMGKDVNLAARLMSKAHWGEIVAGPATLKAVEGEFDVIEKGKEKFKGIKSPIAIKSVAGLKERNVVKMKRTELIGREKEIEILDDFVSGTSRGDAAIIRIIGEAGSGKSVLMERAFEGLNTSGTPVLRSSCFEHTLNTPLSPVGDILKTAVGIVSGDSRDIRKKTLVSALERIGFSEWEGLISRLAGYTLKPTAEINNLSENAKREKTFQLIHAILADFFDNRNGCVIIDDLHWGDATTREFLGSCAEKLAARGISLLIVSRVSDNLPSYEKQISINLGSLDDSSGRRLFKKVLGKKIDSEFVTEIVKSSGGNPFYLEEMAKAVRDMGAGYWTDKKGIPDSVERVITARIDRLDGMVKNTIRTASIVGRVFGLDELSDIFKPRNKVSKIPAYLRESAKLDITPLRKTEPTVEYGFKHILTREVAYSGLSYKSRRVLHQALAEYYKKNRLSGGIASELIGHHYENSDSPLKAAPYYLRAGQAAAKAFSNSEAIHNYFKVIEILESDGYRNHLCRAHLGLGRVYKLVGEYEKSELHLNKALKLCSTGKIWQADSLKELSELLKIKSEFDKASEVLSRLKSLDENKPSYAAIYQNGLGDIARRRGDLELAVKHLSDGLRYGDEIDPGLHAQILNNMGISLWILGRLGEAIMMYNLAGDIYKKKRDLQGAAKISNNTGIILEQQGKLYAACDYYRQAAEIFEKIGDRRSQGYCYGNLATNFIVRGLPSMARSYIDKALNLFKSIGDRSSIAMTIGNLSDWYHFMGDKDSERDLNEKALKLAVELGNDELKCEANIRKARSIGGVTAESLNLLKSANEKSRAKKWHDLEIKSEYHLIEWEVLFGEGGNGMSLIERLETLRAKGPPPEILCGTDRLIALVFYQRGDNEAARVSFMQAYKSSVKSDLVSDRWRILSLYRSFYPDRVRNFESKEKALRERIFEGLDKPSSLMLKARLRRRLDLYLSKAVKAVDPPAKTGKIARLFHS